MSAAPPNDVQAATAAAFDGLDRPKPLKESSKPPGDRYCDLVLTGGVADGIVYPWAIVEIARSYRFKNLAGTSVGALAAALAAAAELSRRQGHLGGFDNVLLKLPERLAELVNGRTRLYSLFQPEKSTRRLFELFVGFFSPKSDPPKPGLIGKVVRAVANAAGTCGRISASVLRVYWFRLLVGALAGLAISAAAVALWGCYFVGPGFDLTSRANLLLIVMLTVPSALLCAAISLALAVRRDGENLINNNYGLCTGGHVEGVPADEKSLVEWLHQGIQGAARRPLDEPLTFKDLWDAPFGPVEGPMEPALATKKSRSIDLRMITTCLTQGRPYQLPLEDDADPMYFSIEELGPYFPTQVLDHLKRVATIYRPGPQDPQPDHPDYIEVRELPKGDLPIIVAARLSLSFPILFSTVPLWAIDPVPVWDQRTQTLVTRKAIRRCQFSDGGICSNFPIHVFDAAIPDWPTFGISLVPNLGGDEDRVWLPNFHYEGREESRYGFDDKGKSPWQRLGGFLGAIGFSAKDWSDNAVTQMPGVRDRVVRILMKAGQGGLDLRLSAQRIGKLAELGTQAGRELVAKFTDPDSPFGPSQRWHEHRWVRFNTFLAALRERTEGLFRATEEANHCKRLSDQISAAARERPLEGASPRDPASQGPLTQEQAGELLELFRGLAALERMFSENSSAQPYSPQPRPTLHVRPPV